MQINFGLLALSLGWVHGVLTIASADYGPSETLTIQSSVDGKWDEAIKLVDTLITKLSVEEKTRILTGNSSSGGCNGNIAAVPSVNFTGLCLADGPLGIRAVDLASTFSAGVTMAASWDKDLIYIRNRAVGAEFRGKGANVYLGPTAGALGRHPLGGRNWEGFSPDPYLTGVATAAAIRGTQDAGVQACVKHLIGNEQETHRSNTFLPNGTEVPAISSNIDDRTTHELYLWPFADAVKSGVASVMCSYNRVNGSYSCENSKLLNGLLKEELGFKGYVLSDWYATHSGVPSINSGLDMTMPGSVDTASAATGISYFGQNITWALENNTISVDRLDDMVRRVLTPYFLLGQDQDFPTPDPSNLYVLLQTYGYSSEALGFPPAPAARDVRGDHGKLIRKLGSAGIVLLKNTNDTLPLVNALNVGIFGSDAADVTDGLYFEGTRPGAPTFGFNIGTLSVGGGSGTGRSSYIVSPLQAMRERISAQGGRLQYILDNDFIAAGDLASLYPIPDICIVFLKTWSSEGSDRTAFENDHNSTIVVNNIASLCPNTIVVTHSAGVNIMPWATNPNVTAIVAAHLPGQESGNSIADVLYGDINPSGHLPYTIPVKASDYDIPIVNITGSAAADGANLQSNFTEGLLIDYRHFDAYNITPQYEFGFGLSYTAFELNKNISISMIRPITNPRPAPAEISALGGNPDLYTEHVCINGTVMNTGKVAGGTALQLYLSLKGTDVPSGTPVRVLRGFEKLYLDAGESKTVEFKLTRRDLSFWNTTAQDWQVPSGKATVSLGFSSRDIRAGGEVMLL